MKSVRIWLWIGVFMVLVQVMLGGITRLTESGLSITEWDVVMGSFPPTSSEGWQQEFENYQKSAQESLLKRRDELLKPLLDKINAALVALGKEENYLFIFDSSSGLLHFPAADNVSEKIAARISK